ncbi:MAG TPA: hypothetical protein VJP40_10040 [bacterium]|nr:hypothetical protein [bacterium]
MIPGLSKLSRKYRKLSRQAATAHQAYVIRFANPEHRQKKHKRFSVQGWALLTIGDQVLRLEGETRNGKPLRWAPDLASLSIGWTRREWRHGYIHWFFLEDRSRRVYLSTESLRRGPTRQLYDHIVQVWQNRLQMAEKKVRSMSPREAQATLDAPSR